MRVRSTCIALASFALALVTACGAVETPDPGDVDASATIDADPGDVDASATIDAPPADPDAMVVSCTPSTFLSCNGGDAIFCNGAGDGTMAQSCGAPGCNAAAGRCNQCAPSTTACDGNVLERCDAAGLPLADESCARACVAAPAPHCAYISPTYLPDVCDTAAAMPSLTISTSVTIDTNLDTNCTGGVINQSGGPPFCVLRYGTITVESGRTLTLTGGRAAALVTDGALQLLGTLDASANGTTSGPGGGLVSSGGLSSSSVGGGGAGARTAGAAGGTFTVTGGAGNGGAAFDPLTGTVLIGGRRAAGPNVGLGVFGGGGGGAVNLISCRGTVTMSGVIDVGGGGGNGGTDLSAGSVLQFRGGGGGGTGGYAVLQGLGINVTGNLFANGGGGGGGGANDAAGGPGADGSRSAFSCAAGGTPLVGAGGGGAGGCAAAGPGGGVASGNCPGGGGGAAGRFQVYAPTGATVTLTPNQVSPILEPTLTITTR